MEKFKILKINSGSRDDVEDVVAEEVPFTVNLDEKELVTLLCMPSDLEELALGLLFTSGLIKQARDVKKIIINREQWVAYAELVNPDMAKELVFKRLYTSGCGRGILFYSPQDLINKAKVISDFKIEAQKVNSLVTDFQKKSEAFLKTGGVHSAGLADKDGILIFKEDIGRHNAVDKVIGCALKGGCGFENKILISSGRVSSEILFKSQKCRVPLVVSQSAPTNQAVRLARDMQITLVGFARGSRMNIYSAEQRII